MKKMVLLILALVVGCVIFMMVYKQRQNAFVSEQIAELPDDVIEDINQVRQDIENMPAEEQPDLIAREMEMIENDYQRDTDQEMPEEVKETIQNDLMQSTEQK
jgi:predicted PurR-regulated permease PerM